MAMGCPHQGRSGGLNATITSRPFDSPRPSPGGYDLSRCRGVRSLGRRPRRLEGRRQDVRLHRRRHAGRLRQDRQRRDGRAADRRRRRREGTLFPPLLGEPALGHGRGRASLPAGGVLQAGSLQPDEEGAGAARSNRVMRISREIPWSTPWRCWPSMTGPIRADAKGHAISSYLAASS